jgi:hypothetical protein
MKSFFFTDLLRLSDWDPLFVEVGDSVEDSGVECNAADGYWVGPGSLADVGEHAGGTAKWGPGASTVWTNWNCLAAAAQD